MLLGSGSTSGNLGRKGGLTEQDPDWGWTRKAIAFLLARGFESDGIPLEARHEAWYALERLTNDPDPTPEYESQSDAKKDPASFLINTTRGEAMHAVIGYALWVHRNIENEPNAKLRTAQGFDQMAEVRIVLDRHLDPSAEPSIAIRAVYGQWFPSLHFLDRDWARASMPAIFPHDEASKICAKTHGIPTS